MAYRLELARSADKALEALPRNVQARIRDALAVLQEDPRCAGVTRMQGQSAYRYRVGEYRIVYDIHDDVLVVLVLKIGHRREVYR